MNSNRNIALKGRFTPFDIYIFQTSFILIAIFILFYQILSSDSIANAASIETILCILAFVAMFIFMYCVMTDRYYFYEFSQDKITVHNFLKKHKRDFFYTRIIKIKFIGKIEYPFMYKNYIHILYNENNIQKSYSYQSIQLETKDWIEFIKIMDAQNIIWENSDPENIAFVESQLNRNQV